MMIANAAPTAPVMNHLHAVDDVVRRRRVTAVVSSIDGSEPAPGGGSVMQKHERNVARCQRPQPAFLLRGRGHRSSRCMLPSSGAKILSASGPSSE